MSAVRIAALLIGAEIAAAGMFVAVGATGGLHGVAYADVDSAPAMWSSRQQLVCVVVTDETGNVWAPECDWHNVGLPPCPYEDGNPNGLPCMWRDPQTGRLFYTTSDEYRR